MPRLFVGIDPGKSGAIVSIGSECGRVCTFPMPVVSGDSREEYDTQKIRSILFEPDCMVFIERQQPLPPKMGGSLASYWRGASQYLFEGLCVGLQIPYEIVRPVDWQKEFFQGLSKDLGKQRSVIVCKRLFPGVDIRRTPRCHKDDDGIADAILIAEYGRRRRERA